MIKYGNDKYFKFDGKNSIDFLCFASQGGMLSVPAKKGEFTSIPGRHQDMYDDEEVFENITRTFSCFIPDNNFLRNYNNLMEYLMSKNGYQKIEWGLQPELFSYAVYIGGTDPDVKYGGRGAEFDLEFNFDPRKYYKQEYTERTLDFSQAVKNKSRFKAKPLILVTRGSSTTTAGVLKVNDTVITIPASDADFSGNGIYIDSENMNCYNANGTNKNSVVQINWESEDPYPVLHPGDNNFTAANLTAKITPRIWTI